MTNFQRTASWFAACGKQPGNEDHFSTQIGCDLEEFVEGLSCIELNLQPQAMDEAVAAISLLESLAGLLKIGAVKARIVEGKRAEFLDAICDREVTGNGLAYLAGFDKDGADEAVLNSNDSKLEDGKPVFVEGTSKIGKGRWYVAPDLTPYI